MTALIVIASLWGIISLSLLSAYFLTGYDISEKQLFVSLAWPIVGLRYIFRGAKEWYNDD